MQPTNLTIDLPDEPVYLNADRAPVIWVFGNLLNNSCKYTRPKGMISVTAKINGDELLVTVKGRRRKTPPDKLDSIFDMFMQVDRNAERSGRPRHRADVSEAIGGNARRID